MKPIHLQFDHWDSGNCQGIFYRMGGPNKKTKFYYAHQPFDSGLFSATPDWFEACSPVSNPERYAVDDEIVFVVNGVEEPFDFFKRFDFKNNVGICHKEDR